MSASEPQPGRQYGGKSPAERTAGRHQRLLEAGLDLFGTQGYSATSIEALCRASRVTPRYFYESFSSREELLAEIYEQLSAELLGAVSKMLGTTEGINVDIPIAADVTAFFHGLLDDPRRARIICIEVAGENPTLERRRQGILHDFADLISAGATQRVRGSETPPGAFDMVALAIVGGIYQVVVDWLSGFITAPIEEIADEMTSFIRDALAGVSLRRSGRPTMPR